MASDDLRTRIAKVLDRHYYNNTLSMADALIRELPELQEDWMGRLKHVTEWTDDNE